MLKVTVIAVGKLKKSFWRDACDEYSKRLQKYIQLTVREIPDSNPASEADLIEAALDSLERDSQIWLLAIDGTLISSEELAEMFDATALRGISHIVFIIGGSDGVTSAVQKRAHRRLSLGRITMPHNLARVVVLEQIYRACKISRHEPYHK